MSSSIIAPDTVYRTLAVASMLKKHVDSVEKNAKNYIVENNLLDEGGKEHATANGNNIATISRTTQGASTYQITDLDAFAAWVKTRDIPYPVEETETVTVTDIDGLTAACEKAGINLADYTETEASYTLSDWASSGDVLTAMLESQNLNTLPDGVEEKKGRASTVMVRQSQAQREALLEMLPPAKQLLALLEAR